MMRAVYTWIAVKHNLYVLIVSLVFILFITGIFFLFYAYIAEASYYSSTAVLRGILVQIIAFVIGVGFMLLVSRIRYQVYHRFILFISIFSGIAMLSLFTPLAIERNGAVRWIDLSIIQFQPSEVMKITIIFLFALIFTNPNIRSSMRRVIGYTLGLFATLCVVSFLQPDYGTTLILFLAVMGMALVTRLPWQWWVTVLVCAGIGLGSVLAVPSYISDRVETFYDIHFSELTQRQRHGSAYQPLQNLKAVRMGGITGQGPGFMARSTHLNIPELTTDSIFAVIAAETGFVGSMFVISLFFVFFTLCYTVANFTRDPFGKCIVVGITTMFAVQFFINVLVVLAFPATGVPLIFFSRGGTSLVLTMVAVGIILNVLHQQSARKVSLKK